LIASSFKSATLIKLWLVIEMIRRTSRFQSKHAYVKTAKN